MGRTRAFAAAGLFVLAGLAACDSGTGVDDRNTVASVRITPGSGLVDIQSTLQLQALALNADGEQVPGVTFTWSSSDPSVASVSSTGLVSGLAEGSVIVSATTAGVSGTAQVGVNDPFPPEAPSDLTVEAASQEALTIRWRDNAGNETRFEVERESGGGAFVSVGQVPADVATFTDSGLDPETEYRYRVRACNPNGCSDYAGAVAGATNAILQVVGGVLPEGEVQIRYSHRLVASGGDNTFTWAAVGGTVPPGLEVEPDGDLFGVPTRPGTFSFTARATSGDGQVAEATFSVFILGPLEFVTQSLPVAEIGRPLDLPIETLGGRPPVTFSLTDGSLPSGTQVTPEGVLTGIPGEVGTFAFQLTATDALGVAVQGELSLTVIQKPLAILSTSLPNAQVNVAYLQGLAFEGGATTDYDWSVTAGALPEGLALDPASGEIEGTPVTAEASTFTVEVVNGPETASAELTLTVDPGPVSVNRYLPAASAGFSYPHTIRSFGGDGRNYTFALTGGELPPGLTLAADGGFDGTPSDPGVYYFSVQGSSAGRTSAPVDLTLTVSTNPPDAFNMNVLNVAGIIPSDEFRVVQDAVLARWEEIVVGDLEDVDIGENDFRGSSSCGVNGVPLNGGFIDDAVVMVNIGPIDGPGGTLGFAGPCYIRFEDNDQPTTVAGILTLDSQDIQNWDFVRSFAITWHEIGHIMGIGTLWNFGVNNFRIETVPNDPRFVGPLAVSGYEEIGGTDPDIPVANTGGPGTANAHWREATFNEEIMTGYSERNGEEQPISLMTIQSLADLGYTVDPEAADFYFVPAGLTAESRESRQEGISFGNDILNEPIIVRRRDGSITVVRPLP